MGTIGSLASGSCSNLIHRAGSVAHEGRLAPGSGPPRNTPFPHSPPRSCLAEGIGSRHHARESQFLQQTHNRLNNWRTLWWTGYWIIWECRTIAPTAGMRRAERSCFHVKDKTRHARCRASAHSPLCSSPSQGPLSQAGNFCRRRFSPLHALRDRKHLRQPKGSTSSSSDSRARLSVIRHSRQVRSMA